MSKLAKIDLTGAREELRIALPGLYLVIAVAVVSRYLHSLIPIPAMSRAISEVFIAVFLGLHIRNAIHYSHRFDAGIRFAMQHILRFAVVLLGLRLSLQDVVDTGLRSLLLVLACIALALTLASVAGKLLKIPRRLAVLIGVGTAICGNTAIVAVAPVIEAKDEDVSFAVATITFFGTFAVLVYPFIGYFTGMTDREFGIWAGTAVNDTSQVVAAGAAFSEAARDVATVVKLTRNALMAPIILLIGMVYARLSDKRSDGQRTRVSWSKAVPGFVIGFIAMAALRTLGIAVGVLPQSVADPGALTGAASLLRAVDEVSKFAVLMALSAIGLGTDVGAVRRTGAKPFVLGLGISGVLAVFSAGVILLTGMGR